MKETVLLLKLRAKNLITAEAAITAFAEILPRLTEKERTILELSIIQSRRGREL